MSFEARLIVVTLAAFGAGGLAGAALVPWLWGRLTAPTAAARAAALLRLRVLPAGLGVVAALLAAISYLLFESRTAEEGAGVTLFGLAALAIGAAVTSLARSWRLSSATRRTLRRWLATGEPLILPSTTLPAFAVATPFPIVAVIGVFRPRLVVARSVLESCTADELATIVAHEQAHVAHRDNLARALFLLTPDVVACLPLGTRLLGAWRDATEEAADDCAAQADGSRRVTLAQALIKVARLAPATSLPAPLPASALYRGENLDRRVRRLLDPPADPRPAPSFWLRRTIALLTVAAGGLALGAVQDVIELAVNFLP